MESSALEVGGDDEPLVVLAHEAGLDAEGPQGSGAGPGRIAASQEPENDERAFLAARFVLVGRGEGHVGDAQARAEDPVQHAPQALSIEARASKLGMDVIDHVLDLSRSEGGRHLGGEGLQFFLRVTAARRGQKSE